MASEKRAGESAHPNFYSNECKRKTKFRCFLLSFSHPSPGARTGGHGTGEKQEAQQGGGSRQSGCCVWTASHQLTCGVDSHPAPCHSQGWLQAAGLPALPTLSSPAMAEKVMVAQGPHRVKCQELWAAFLVGQGVSVNHVSPLPYCPQPGSLLGPPATYLRGTRAQYLESGEPRWPPGFTVNTLSVRQHPLPWTTFPADSRWPPAASASSRPKQNLFKEAHLGPSTFLTCDKMYKTYNAPF